MEHNHHSSKCQCASVPRSVNQTLDELDFERGIWNAALNGDSEKTEKLLRKGCDPDILDNSGYTALHYACRNNHEGVINLLLYHGADVNVITRSGGASPLHRAAFMGHVNIVKMLLDRGAKASTQDNDGKSALHKAAENGHIEVCRLLIHSDSSLLNLKDKREMTAAEIISDGTDKLKDLLSPG